jgi:hypothetical protein
MSRMPHDLRAHQQATVAAAEGELDGSDHEGGTLGDSATDQVTQG